jgi:hypothetical protein
MENLDFTLLILRWLHFAAAIAALGGALFSRFILIPSANQSLDRETHDRLREAIRARWAPFVHGCIAVLLLTGMLNFYFLVLAPGVKPMPYHALFGVKFIAAMFVFFVAEALVSPGPGLARIKQARARWLSALLVGAALVVLLSGALSQIRIHGSKPAIDAPQDAPRS